ncbi:MAG: Gfo/Idh/MocA family oxidoreductase [Spirochaetia bacterium]|nr:Gfo/Idh/MocA family oxidoreductase [Spirochaetia bacterium]
MSIKVALIGLGRIGWSLEKDKLRYHPCTHGGTIHALGPLRERPLYNLAGICDTDPAKMKAFKKWWGAPLNVMQTDYRVLIQETKPALAVVAVPPGLHQEMSVHLASSGVKGIILEKPIALDLAGAKQIQKKARQNNVNVWVNFERRFHPAYRIVREFVQSGRLGPVRRVTGRVLTGGQTSGTKKQGAAGPLLHDAVHWIDLLLWLFGRPAGVSARMMRDNAASAEHTALVDLDYGEFSASLESGGRRKYFEFTMEIDFQNGRVRAGNDGHHFFQAGPSRRYQGFNELAPFRVTIPEKNPWTELYKHTASQLKLRQGGTAQDNLDDAVAGMEIIDRCIQSL